MRIIIIVLVNSLIGCATGYHASSSSGGFQQTRLGVGVYQVRFQGNGLTDHDLVSTYLLRRCAELTLENGSRYFEVGEMAHQTTTAVTGSQYMVMSVNIPRGETVMRILPPGKTGLDAITVVRETNEAADGVLSEAARATLGRIVREDSVNDGPLN